MHFFQTIFLAVLLAIVVPTPSRAGEQAVIKTIPVRVSDLDRLPQTTFSTTTLWHTTPAQFSGVLLKDYLAANAITAKKMRLVALNDYMVETDVEVMVRAGALFTTRVNGQRLEVSDKGPVFVLFNFDSNPALQHPMYYARSVWQLDKIEIQE